MPEELNATAIPVFEKKDIDENKLIAAIGYVSFLCFVPLLLKKDSRFAQEHGKQGFVLFVAEIVIWLLAMVPVIGWFVVGPIGSILVLIVSVFAIFKTLQGEFWEIPYIGKYRKDVKF